MERADLHFSPKTGRKPALKADIQRPLLPGADCSCYPNIKCALRKGQNSHVRPWLWAASLGQPYMKGSDHPPPSYPPPTHISVWDRRKEEDIKGRVRFPVFGMRPSPALTLFRRGTALYRKVRTWSHGSPEGISKGNAFISVHSSSQVKASCFSRKLFYLCPQTSSKHKHSVLRSKSKVMAHSVREPLPEDWVQSKPENLLGPQEKMSLEKN